MITSDTGMRNLCAAIVEQAIKDWRVLCKLVARDDVIYMTPTRTMYWNANRKRAYIGTSFDELRSFFAEDAELYTDMDTMKMLSVLERERQKAFRKRDRLRARKGD